MEPDRLEADRYEEAYRRRLDAITASQSIRPYLARFREHVFRHLVAVGIAVFAITLVIMSFLWTVDAANSAVQSILNPLRRW